MSRASDNEHFARLNQAWLGVEVDGWAGRRTQEAWRERTADDGSHEAPFPAPDERSLRAYYGPPGESNLATFHLPYPMILAWDHSVTVTRARCHRLVKDSLAGVLERTRDHYGDRESLELSRMHLLGGIYMMRPQRGSSRTLSTHAWGISIDLDPRRNAFRTPCRTLAASDAIYEAAVARWKAYRRRRGLPTSPVPEASFPPVVAGFFADAGWTNGGVAWGSDAMHNQATR